MLRIFIILSFFVSLISCSGVSVQTRVGISQKINIFGAKRDLQQFYSDQEAHESGAILLGSVEGEICHGDGIGKTQSLLYNSATPEAIDLLKEDVIRKSGNAFTINSCIENSLSYCDVSALCTGQAYDLYKK